jgi:FG-GAP-like repeat
MAETKHRAPQAANVRGTALTGAALAGLVLLASPAGAQFNRRWVQFENETATRLVSDPGLGVSDPEEKDYAWGDVDRDGDVDLVVVRKQPGTSAGRRRGVLFLNEGGALVDRTVQYATEADAPGDQGFLTPANNRDVVLADFNGDGWLDVATAVTISDGLPKTVSHPRIYVNKGAVGGAWQGFRFEAARSPQLYVLLANGSPDLIKPQPGRFCAIAAGDVDGDGDVDLYLGDYDSSGVIPQGGATEPPGVDLDDRLWINDGNGFFTDSYRTRMSGSMLASAFNVADVIADMNGDGHNDIVKDTALTSPLQFVGIAYNKPSDPGHFELFQQAQTLSPYFVSVDDLNNDGRLDMVVTDDDRDRYRLNEGNNALGQVQWTSALQVSYPSGAGYQDDGFGGQSVIADLDRDGFKDVLITDMDVDTSPSNPDCSRRMHIYHNLGDVPNVSLMEEAETSSASGGWKGAVGLMPNDLRGTYNVAALDLDNDGDDDLVLGRCSGTSVWINTLCRLKASGTPLPNSSGQPGRMAWSGTAARSDHDLTLRARNLPPGAPGLFVVAESRLPACVPDGGGLRCVGRYGRRQSLPATADASGNASAVLDFDDPRFDGLTVGTTRYVQFRYEDPGARPTSRAARAGTVPGAAAASANWTDTLELKVCP